MRRRVLVYWLRYKRLDLGYRDFISLIVINFLFSLVITSCGVEKLNLKSDNFSYRKKVNGEWTNFTDWEPINVKVEIKKIPFSGFIRDDSGRFNINKCKFIIYDNPN